MTEDKRLITSKDLRYETIRKLGEGYTGEVYLAKDLQRGEPVALKLLNPEAFKEGQLEAFKREFILLSDLHHPHLCKVYDFGFSDSDQRYFFTSELIQGTDLYPYTDNLSIDEIEEIFVQITDALGFIHSAGLIHFDIKGANILMTTLQAKPLAKIVDFGLAAPSVDVPENIVGTVRYMSPEMITKNQTIDYRADLYSLGIVLYRMLAKGYPNQGSTMKDIINWHVKHTGIETASLVAQGVPKYLIEVIEKLTKPIPTERFSSASVIIKYIELHSGRNYEKTQRALLTTLTEEGPLVARDGIMHKIRATIAKMSKKEPLDEGTNPTLVLTGTHGIGKSRILKETKYISQLSEIQTIIVRGREDGQAMEGLKKALKMSADDPGRDLIPAVTALQPLCLMIDDLDRCNQQVKDAVVGLVNSLYSSKFLGTPLAVYPILTMTTGDKKESLPLPLHLGVDVEFLHPFTEHEITQYVRAFLGESNPPTQQIRDIQQFSGGIPELVRIAIATLETSTSRLTKDTGRLFIERIDQLPEPTRKVLGMLAIADQPLSQQQLIILTGLTVEAAVNELARTGFVRFDRGNDTYRIATGAVATAVREHLPEEERKDISSRLLEYIETEEPDNIDQIIRFAAIGAAPEKKKEYLLKAAGIKEDLNQLDQAYQYYWLALGSIQASDPEVPNIHRKLARFLILTGKYEEAKKHIDEASKLTGLLPQDLRSLSWIDRLTHDPKAALVHVQDALNHKDLVQGDPTHLTLLNEKAQCYLQIGDVKEAANIFRDTHQRTMSLPPEKRREVVNNNLGLALAQDGRYDEAIEFYKEKNGVFADDKRLSASILSQLGYVYQQSGHLDEAIETYKKSWELASSIGDTHSAQAVLSNIICLCQSKALYSDALTYAQESIKLASQAASEKDMAANMLTIGSLYTNLGLEDVAQKYLTEAAAIFQKLGDQLMEAWVQLSFAYMYKNLGRNKEALAHLENVIKKAKAVGSTDLTDWGYYVAADIYIDAGSPDKAEGYLSEVTHRWTGAENAPESALKAELLRCRLAMLKSAHPQKEIAVRLEEIASISIKQGLRELVSEVYHALGTFYQKLSDEKTSAEYVARAKEIIDDIVGTLSEEYRDSFMRQQFRKTVSEDSIRLEKSLSHLNLEEELGEEPLIPAPKTEEVEIAPAPSAPPTNVAQDRTVDISEARGDKTSAMASRRDLVFTPVLVGQSDAILRLREMVEHVKDSSLPVLITGEAGTGKTLLAEIIRDAGAYRNRPWQRIDASSLPEKLLTNELFGREKEGLLELAANGILFLKQIEALPGGMQKDLYKILKNRTYTRLRDKSTISLICRIIASANASTEKLIKEKKFNKDLLKELSEIVIDIPPLRERQEDIPLLIDHFLERLALERNVAGYSLKTEALQMLLEHQWTGNVKELEKVLKSACVLAKDLNITPEQIKMYLKK